MTTYCANPHTSNHYTPLTLRATSGVTCDWLEKTAISNWTLLSICSPGYTIINFEKFVLEEGYLFLTHKNVLIGPAGIYCYGPVSDNKSLHSGVINKEVALRDVQR